MSDKETFSEKLTNFILGKPAPTLSEQDLRAIRGLEQKLDSLLDLLNAQGVNGQPSNDRISASQPNRLGEASQERLDELAEQVRKLAKTQFKTNTLQESQLAQQQETLKSLQESMSQRDERMVELAQQREQAIEAAQLELLKSLLPALDSLDAAFDTGRRQVLKLPMRGEVRQAVIGWLDGIRLARMRLLDVFAAYDVTPIPALGQPFDPHRHVATATDTSGRAPDGIIVGEDRRGYATPDKVLRFAEVVVARSGSQQKSTSQG